MVVLNPFGFRSKCASDVFIPFYCDIPSCQAIIRATYQSKTLEIIFTALESLVIFTRDSLSETNFDSKVKIAS